MSCATQQHKHQLRFQILASLHKPPYASKEAFLVVVVVCGCSCSWCLPMLHPAGFDELLSSSGHKCSSRRCNLSSSSDSSFVSCVSCVAAAGAGMSTTNIKSLIQALPQFREMLGRLSVHIFISSELKNVLDARSLTDLGELEQNLIYGDKTSQDLIKYLAGGCADGWVGAM